jgi:DNA ligase-associated metallophosphoesterase
MKSNMQIRIKDQTLELLSHKAFYWKEEKTIVLSDLHLGKVSYFRKEGIPVPSAGIDKNFSRLDQLLNTYNVERMIFTGDLFHGKENEEWNLFRTWRRNHSSVQMDIAMGNHDELSPSHYKDIYISVSECDLVIPPFTFCHHPKKEPVPGSYFISGHVHPVFSIHGMASQSVRLPCFYFGKYQAILPSFGYFTGGYEIRRQNGDRIYVVVENSVLEVGK